METLTLEITTAIKASKEIVWQALTNAEQIKKYFFGTETKSDWKVGSSITFSGLWDGKPYLDKGTILEIEHEKILKYNYWSSFAGTEDVPTNYANITYSLEEKSGETMFTIIQDSIKTEEAREHSKQNWQLIMNSMKELLEK
jgi:uncharacterized protein YndB with AHSA1/START domain